VPACVTGYAGCIYFQSRFTHGLGYPLLSGVANDLPAGRKLKKSFYFTVFVDRRLEMK
jgi:hypothetical protein